jgi:gluconolactonase
MKTTNEYSPVRAGGVHAFLLIALLIGSAGARPAFAEDWGSYALVPVSAPGMTLEVVGSATDDGAIVSIGKPAGTANQKWVILPKDNGFVSIHPSNSTTLVLAAAKGGKNEGTAIVVETDKDQPLQQWSLKKNANGNYTFAPRHAPGMGLDDFGGKQAPGSRIDLWTYNEGDEHLHWMIKPLAGSPVSVGSNSVAELGGYVPPTIDPKDVPKGEIKKTSFTESAIFPGTVRDVTVFIPAQYDGSKPACVYVKTDSYNPIEKELLETLIATKEMPVTIGVFVSPGNLPATVKGTQGRRNRDFEYDGVSDNNVRFLVDELLPFVAKKFDLKLSTSGNDRCIAGGSSGGIAAFTAAWLRPDAFSRVYAGSGSFVAFRGGNEFPTLVRKFEAKPIRAYLTTGTHDMENCAGDWFLLDQEMDKALKFSGYDYFFRTINGGHVAGYYDYYREGMSYLWKNWPEPVHAGPSAPRARDILVPDENWQPLAEGIHAEGGPACNAAGEVFFASSHDDKIYRIALDGKIQEFVTNAGRPNGLSFGPNGELFAVSTSTAKVTSYDAAGKGTLVIDGIPGRHVLALPTGGLYITAPGEKPEDPSVVWFIKDGKKTVVDSGLKFATGLAYRPDQWLLSVADGHSKWAYSYQINPDGSLANKERFFTLHVADWDDDAGAESVCFAKEGQMFVATRSGIQVCADDGPTQVILPLPDSSRVLGLCLAGKEMDTLFAFTADKIWKRKVKTHGIAAFSPWVKVNGTPL